MGLLSITDFQEKDYYYLPVDKFSKLGGFITDFGDDQYLCEMMGVTTYALYKADLDPNSVPQNQPWTDIFNPFCKEVDPSCCDLDYRTGKLNSRCKELAESIGIKDMLRGFIYYEFLTNFPYQKTPTGNKFMISANSEQVSDTQNASDAEDRYNRSIKTYRAIQKYICEQKSLGVVEFADFSGFPKDFKLHGIF